ncbi:MAG: CRISPR-associated helicase/endonuclease Cas3 [bacterium]
MISRDKDGKYLNSVVGFFLALHDLGKFDIRFQSRVPEVRNLIWHDLNQNDLLLSPSNITEYNHGKAGYDIFVKFYTQFLGLESQDEDVLDKWKPWIAAVTGHHGIIPRQADWHKPSSEQSIIEHDHQARMEWFKALRTLFWGDDKSTPLIPELSQESIAFIAGFCSVADWIASNDLFVQWIDDEIPLEHYFEEAKEHCRKTDILKKVGVVGCQPSSYGGISSLLSNKDNPRQIQTLIDDMLPENGLLIIEAPTGSGKTEAALALAWKLIDSGQADSIVFALPTQATADAMLERIENLAPVLFKGGDANLVLAHGKAKYNENFANLKAAGRPGAAQKGNEGAVQCAQWISSSRKRVFLGQIGVCTIDQVLLSVLPLRHNFVRSFGLMKSVLIVDEVHAYDRYMYGLLEEVLKRQKSAGGCAILLSATLPAVQKQELFKAWHEESSAMITDNAPYPLISKISVSGENSAISVTSDEMPPERVVHIELAVSDNMQPDEPIVTRLLDAARGGALVAVVCNLVKDAQKTAKKLRSITSNSSIRIDIFHARYRFKDRQKREKIVKEMYGKSAPRGSGRILVATQVVEQSLDLDFDWLLTQLCPVDLLFQRMGRMHRHDRPRPAGFEKPICTVLISEKDDFGTHECIYQDARVLWRTRELLKKQGDEIRFPTAYRELIEAVYGKAAWDDEPDSVIGKSLAFRQEQERLWYDAQQRATIGMNPFADTDQNAATLTRGSEMSLTVVPIQAGVTKKTLLDGECLFDVNEFQRDELLNMNTISAPAGWKEWLPSFEDGYIYLPMENVEEGWVWRQGKYSLKYTEDFGLEQLEEKE